MAKQLEDDDLKFMRFITSKDDIKGKNTERILGTVWKMRTDLNMVKYVMDLVEYGNTHFASCRDIICLINETRKKVSNPFRVDGAWPPVNFFVHDANSGFDSEAGNTGEGSIYVNLCGRAAFKDKSDKVWYVPSLIVIYHELGHYLQYLSNPEYYNTVAGHPDEGKHHLLDAMNVPDNEYPICRDLGMGVREYYLDMQDVTTFGGHTINYTRVLERKYARDEHGFQPAVEPEDVRRSREELDRRKREGLGLGTAKKMQMATCEKCDQKFPKLGLVLHAMNCTGKK